MLVLDKEIYFWLLAGLIPITLLYIYFVLWRKKKIKSFAETKFWNRISINVSKRKSGIKFLLFLLLFISGTIALVNPKIGSKLKTITREGVDIVFVLDVSKSMLAEDTKPSRIEKSKGLVSKMMNEFVSDRVGIVVYAGKAYPQLPLTTDYSAAKMFLKNVNTDIVPSNGTNVGAAINMAFEFFDSSDEKNNRTIILISDGEDHENDSFGFAKKAKEKGVIIHTIALGTTRGAPIPIKNKKGEVLNYKKDKENEVVITKLNPEFLKKISALTNGNFTDGNNTKSTIKEIKDALMKMEKGESETEMFEDYEDQFQWFILLALLFLLTDLFTRKGKTNWLRKINK